MKSVEFHTTITEKGGNILADVEALKKVVDNSGMTKTAIARKTGILRPTLYSKLSGASEFTVSEAVAIAKVLHLTEEERNKIFLS